MYIRFYIIFFLLQVGLLTAQEASYPNFIGQTYEEVSKNQEWYILSEDSGLLNEDNISDRVVVLESKDSVLEKRCEYCKVLPNKARILLVFLSKNDAVEVVIQNNHFIARPDEGGMLPLLEPEIEIENNLMRIDYQYTRTHTYYYFKCVDIDCLIHSFESGGVISAGSGEMEFIDIDFQLMQMKVETGNISSDTSKVEEYQLTVPAKSLREFGSMYTWDIRQFIML